MQENMNYKALFFKGLKKNLVFKPYVYALQSTAYSKFKLKQNEWSYLTYTRLKFKNSLNLPMVNLHKIHLSEYYASKGYN
jgi:hypothetical protein